MLMKIFFVSVVLTLGVFCDVLAQDIEPEFLPTEGIVTTTTEPVDTTNEIEDTTTQPPPTTTPATSTELISQTSATEEIVIEDTTTTTKPIETTTEIEDTTTELPPTTTELIPQTTETSTTEKIQQTTLKTDDSTSTKNLETTTRKSDETSQTPTTTVSTTTSTKRPLGCQFTRRRGTPYFCWRKRQYVVPVYCVYSCNCFGHEICYYVNHHFCHNMKVST